MVKSRMKIIFLTFQFLPSLQQSLAVGCSAGSNLLWATSQNCGNRGGNLHVTGCSMHSAAPIDCSGVLQTPNHCSTSETFFVALTTVPVFVEYFCSSSANHCTMFELTSITSPPFCKKIGRNRVGLWWANCFAMLPSATSQYSAINGGSGFLPCCLKCLAVIAVSYCNFSAGKRTPWWTKNLISEAAIASRRPFAYSFSPLVRKLAPVLLKDGFQEACVWEPSHRLLISS